MQEFHILRGSTNPVLQMELIMNGRHDFRKSVINEALQDSEVTFSMVNEETGIFRISKAKADIVSVTEGCEEKFIIQYRWTERDTSLPGVYDAWFEVKFNGNLRSEGDENPKGNLKVPIENRLKIIIS